MNIVWEWLCEVWTYLIINNTIYMYLFTIFNKNYLKFSITHTRLLLHSRHFLSLILSFNIAIAIVYVSDMKGAISITWRIFFTLWLFLSSLFLFWFWFSLYFRIKSKREKKMWNNMSVVTKWSSSNFKVRYNWIDIEKK